MTHGNTKVVVVKFFILFGLFPKKDSKYFLHVSIKQLDGFLPRMEIETE